MALELFYNQSSYGCPKFNKLSMNSNTDLSLLYINIRSIGGNLDTFNCFTNLLNKKFDILSFSESWLNDNNKNLYTIEGYDAFHNVQRGFIYNVEEHKRG